MSYGHAERALAAVRRLEAETRELLGGLEHLDPEQAQWLDEVGRASVPAVPQRSCPSPGPAVSAVMWGTPRQVAAQAAAGRPPAARDAGQPMG